MLQRPALLTALALLAATAPLSLPLRAATAPAAAEAASGGQSKVASGLQTALNHNQSEPDFLPPDEAFRFSAMADGPDKIRLIWGITDGYYLYRARIKASTTTTSWARSPSRVEVPEAAI
jgi:thiol:disulfide interchange protein